MLGRHVRHLGRPGGLLPAKVLHPLRHFPLFRDADRGAVVFLGGDALERLLCRSRSSLLSRPQCHVARQFGRSHVTELISSLENSNYGTFGNLF